MKPYHPVPRREIEVLLERLGAGNHRDNLMVLASFPRFYRASLNEAEFFGLVFLQNDEILGMCPRGQDRSLRAVAKRVPSLQSSRLSGNWKLDELKQTFRERYPSLTGVQLPALTLRDSRGSESAHGDWYLQDGSHRALAYALTLIESAATYKPQVAYWATTRWMESP